MPSHPDDFTSLFLVIDGRLPRDLMGATDVPRWGVRLDNKDKCSSVCSRVRRITWRRPGKAVTTSAPWSLTASFT